MGILTVDRANTVQSSGLDIHEAGFVSTQQTATIARQIRRATTDLEALVVGRNKAELTARLSPACWCVAECLDHLTQTTRAFLPAISDAIAAAPRLKSDRRLRTGIVPGFLIRNLNPPYRIRLKVLPQIAPQNSNSDTAWARFVESQSELLGILSSTTGLAIDKVRIKSPVYARLTYNIYAALRMLAAHQSRHVWQVSQILKALNSRATAGVA